MELDETETTQNTSVLSPPPKRFHPQPSPMRQKKYQQRVRNPFEAALADRLHLPLIASPSLFQRPATPQLSSTQFEWTIDEVSSIKPVNVEAHETQFQDSPDPEFEAKAQLAISSYFKEHQIVPSPVNCSVRQQRIILAEINSNTPIGKPGRRIRDFGTQTELSLPMELPPALEEALRPYFKPHLAGCYTEDGKLAHSWLDGSGLSSYSSLQSGSAHNISMRRKLFDIHNIILWDENRKTYSPGTSQSSSPYASTTDSQLQKHLPLPSIAGKLSDSPDKSSVELSPIFGRDCLSGSPHSPNNLHITTASDSSQNSNSAPKLKKCNVGTGKSGKTKTHRRSFLFNPTDAEELSPIYPAARNKPRTMCQNDETNHDQTQLKDFITPAKVRKTNFTRRRLHTVTINNDDEDDYDIDTNSTKFTPDRSSSPVHSFHSSASVADQNNDHANTVTTESFHDRISRLAVNSSKSIQNDAGRLDISPNDDTDTGDVVDDVEAMQISQLSLQNSNLSSSSINSHCDTPTGKRRSASRKNLSQSFSANWPLDDDDDDEDNNNDDNDENTKDSEKSVGLPHINFIATNGEVINQVVGSVLKTQLPEISDFIAVRTTTTTTTKSGLSDAEKQTQYQSVNFYRTDSGFNEMTTSSTTSNILSLLAQQDELSREASTCKTNEVCSGEVAGGDGCVVGDVGGGVVVVGGGDGDGGGGESQYSKPYCSTPRVICCLTTSDALNNEL